MIHILIAKQPSRIICNSQSKQAFLSAQEQLLSSSKYLSAHLFGLSTPLLKILFKLLESSHAIINFWKLFFWQILSYPSPPQTFFPLDRRTQHFSWQKTIKVTLFWAPEKNVSWTDVLLSLCFCTFKTHSPYFLLFESWELSGMHWILQVPPLSSLEIGKGTSHSLKSQTCWSLWSPPSSEYSVILSAGKDMQNKNLNHIKDIHFTSPVQQFSSST